MQDIDTSAIRVSAFDGPPGACGWRRGTWRGTYQGRQFRYRTNIPHDCELDDQHRLLLEVATRLLREGNVEFVD